MEEQEQKIQMQEQTQEAEAEESKIPPSHQPIPSFTSVGVLVLVAGILVIIGVVVWQNFQSSGVTPSPVVSSFPTKVQTVITPLVTQQVPTKTPSPSGEISQEEVEDDAAINDVLGNLDKDLSEIDLILEELDAIDSNQDALPSL